MTPQHAKLLLHALADNIGKYENQYGEINVDGQHNPFPPGVTNIN
jgi:hypothetical protein